ncbi:MAG: VCBS repeat-containing protein, partial [Chloroflexota bacterium]|nr:VCBS repeat-containing protein [Chloroflexota bacterium]
LNGDGELDLALGNYEMVSQVYLSDGGGSFGAPSDLPGSGRITESVVVGDLNGDGALDLVLGNKGAAGQVYLNDGRGTFPAPRALISGNPRAIRSVAVGDLNGDGALDLVLGTNNVLGRDNVASQVYLNTNDGSGSFSAPSDLAGSSGRPIRSVAMGDLDGDGALDLGLGNAGSISQVFLNTTYRSARLPNNPPTVAITRPGPTLNADFYSTPAILTGPTIALPYTLADPESDPVARIRASYSLDGGANWRPARAVAGTPTTNLSASRAGTHYTFVWDIFADGAPASGFFGQSDDVVFRMQAEPGRSGPKSAAGPFQRPYAASTSFPFRVRGMLPRVLRDGAPLAGAIVYRLRPPSPDPRVDARAQLLKDRRRQPLTTNQQGYLAGRSPIALNDSLIALQPIGATSTYSLYFTSAAPNASGLANDPIGRPGVQTLTVSAANPLMLLNLSVALEWDARRDVAFLNRLQTDLQRVSALLYDFTDGQVALGQITIYQNRA